MNIRYPIYEGVYRILTFHQRNGRNRTYGNAGTFKGWQTVLPDKRLSQQLDWRGCPLKAEKWKPDSILQY